MITSLTTLALVAGMSAADASSHREAPGTSLDPAADITDFYSFINPNDPSKVVFVMNVIPAELPGAGPNFYRFDDNVTYRIHIDNEGDGLEDIILGFRFTTSYDDPTTFLYNTGPLPSGLNQVQTFISGRWDDGVFAGRLSPAGDCTTAPANVGLASVPAGMYNPNSSTPGTATTANICDGNNDVRIFAGPRQEGFFVDLENTFDLLNLAGNTPNINTLMGFNVHSIAIELPVEDVTRDGQTPSTSNDNNVIAAWATTARKQTRVLNGDGTTSESGPLVQVGRLGNPLVNEVVIGVGDKDTFNASHPIDDPQFLNYVIDPLLAVYMEAILGIPNPGGPGGACEAIYGGPERFDLFDTFLVGHPAFGTMPVGFTGLGGAIPGEPGKVYAPFEALRIDLSNPVSSWPNGRMPSDDVVDTALSAMAGLLCDGTTVVPDGVDSAGLSYLDSFPFLGDPWKGNDHPVALRNTP